MLDRCPILIVEDDFFIADFLVDVVEEAGGVVVGSASTTTEALNLLDAQDVRAAILDVNLADRDIEPVLTRCVAEGIATVIHTGTGLPTNLAARFPNSVVLMKPCIPEDVVRALAEVIRNTKAKMQSDEGLCLRMYA
jgi:DNA-binding NtrC family response regulator